MQSDDSTRRTEARLRYVIERVRPLDRPAMAAARERQDTLTKPRGSLGRLERLAVQIAGITGQARPRVQHPVVVVMAADHGVAAEGVSAYPSTVTAQMVHNFIRGGAAINVLARQAGAEVIVVDVGVATPLPPELPIVHRKIAPGTANLATGSAMSRAQAERAIDVGLSLLAAPSFSFAGGHPEAGTTEGSALQPSWPATSSLRNVDIVCLGEMGIGSTTAASAIVAASSGLPVGDVTGRGTGIDDATWTRKVATIERALRTNHPDPSEPLDVLATLGGLEIAGLVGVVLGAAARRLPVVVDGFIATAAALIAVELCPLARNYLIAAHRSVEVGHRAALERLELEPLFALDLRLGEGTGAALALPIITAALAVLDEMATFDEAGISVAREMPPVQRGADR